MSHKIEEALDWWANLSRDDKVRWLPCDATPETVDADLRSPDPQLRAAASMAAVGDAYLAYSASLEPNK